MKNVSNPAADPVSSPAGTSADVAFGVSSGDPALRLIAGGTAGPRLASLVEDFLLDRETGGASRHTLINYRADLRALIYNDPPRILQTGS